MFFNHSGGYSLEIIGVSIPELLEFLSYIATAIALTFVYVIVYMWVTPHDEIKLIRENNAAASVAFSGSLFGFCLPLASTIAHSVSLVDCAIWGAIALVIQMKFPAVSGWARLHWLVAF
jgi:putative membrane protein